MRREVLYQYDLPIEILDAIPADEEVMTVLFGRSKEKFLIPLLLTNLRIVWAYPETETVYKVFEQHYIDITTVSAKFPAAGSPSVTFQTRMGTVVFPNVQDSIEDVRGGLFILGEQMRERTGIHWEVLQQKNLLTDEYILQKNLSVPVVEYPDDAIFEERIRETTPHETLFSHFPAEEEGDVFEKAEVREDQTSAVVDRVARMVEATEPVEEQKPMRVSNDAVIYDVPVTKNEQWHDEGGGDAEILPRGKPWKNMPASKPAPSIPSMPRYAPEDDDSEVYDATPRPKLVVPKPKPVAAPAPAPEPSSEAKTLQPKEEYDEATIDKSLEALKFLRDNNIISEAEYKKRSLSLFEKED